MESHMREVLNLDNTALGPHPLTEEQITEVVESAAGYIQEQREKYHVKAESLPFGEMNNFNKFFPQSILRMTRFLSIKNEKSVNPPFLTRLTEMGLQYADMNSFTATTFNDVVVYRKEPTTQILFHELVHVMQCQELGLKGFTDKYIRGLIRTGSYEKIPLEIQAYELDQKYRADPSISFSVRAEVMSSITGNQY